MTTKIILSGATGVNWYLLGSLVHAVISNQRPPSQRLSTQLVSASNIYTSYLSLHASEPVEK